MNFGSDRRFPLSYIIEAADDISYCLSDIEDGIEKDLVNFEAFYNLLLKTENTEILKELNVYENLNKKT